MISAPGVGSGIDINSIVNQLVSAEGDAKTLILADRISVAEAEISAFGALKSSLESFRGSVTSLKNPDTFAARSVSSSDTDVFTVTGTGDLAVASYEIEVLDFAEAHKLATTGFASQDSTVGTGQMTISVGASPFSITVDGNNNTLVGIRNTINAATNNTGVTASIANVDDGMGGTEAKLVLTADTTGLSNAISVTVTDDDSNHTDGSGLSIFYYDTGDATSPEQMTQLTAAVDASITIDGQAVTSSTNQISNALEGITIDLVKEDPGKKHTLNVSLDEAAVKSTINVFLANYNALSGVINNVSDVDITSQQAGLLAGDRTILTLERQLRRELSNSVQIAGSQISNLVDLGITTNASGNLELDNDTLDAVLKTDLDNISKLFTSEDGIASRLDSLVNDYVKSDGIIDGKTDGLDTTVDRANDDLIALDISLAKLEERLLAQFTAMDQLVAQLNATSDFLNSQLTALTNSLTRSNR